MRALCVLVMAAASGLAAASEDESEIRKVLAASNEAFNRHVSNLTPEGYAVDFDVVNPVGTHLPGKPNLGEAFKTYLKNAKKTETVQRIRYIRPDVALVDTEFDFAGVEMKPSKGLAAYVLAKEDGRWVIKALRSMIPVTAVLAAK